MALLGVALTSGLQWSGADKAGLLTGVLLATAAAFFYAGATLATRKLKGLAPAQIAGLQLAMGALVLAPWVNITVQSISPMAWASMLTLRLVHTGPQYNLPYSAFQRLAAERSFKLTRNWIDSDVRSSSCVTNRQVSKSNSQRLT